MKPLQKATTGNFTGNLRPVLHFSTMRKLDPETLALYLAYKLTSYQVADMLNVHPVTVRRNIKRPPREPIPKDHSKSALIQARNEYRQLHAHLPVKELQEKLHLTRSTAYRVKAKYAPT